MFLVTGKITAKNTNYSNKLSWACFIINELYSFWNGLSTFLVSMKHHCILFCRNCFANSSENIKKTPPVPFFISYLFLLPSIIRFKVSDIVSYIVSWFLIYFSSWNRYLLYQCASKLIMFSTIVWRTRQAFLSVWAQTFLQERLMWFAAELQVSLGGSVFIKC